MIQKWRCFANFSNTNAKLVASIQLNWYKIFEYASFITFKSFSFLWNIKSINWLFGGRKSSKKSDFRLAPRNPEIRKALATKLQCKLNTQSLICFYHLYQEDNKPEPGDILYLCLSIFVLLKSRNFKWWSQPYFTCTQSTKTRDTRKPRTARSKQFLQLNKHLFIIASLQNTWYIIL